VEQMDSFIANSSKWSEIKLNGLIKCEILPPRYPTLPSLHARFREGVNKSLLFPLCRKCATTNAESKDGRSIDELACYHNNWRDRCWTATYTRPEIEAALKSGYIVTKVFRALDFDDWDSEIFKGYVKKFLKVCNFLTVQNLYNIDKNGSIWMA